MNEEYKYIYFFLYSTEGYGGEPGEYPDIKEEPVDTGYDNAYNRSFPANGEDEDEEEEGQYSQYMLQNM